MNFEDWKKQVKPMTREEFNIKQKEANERGIYLVCAEYDDGSICIIKETPLKKNINPTSNLSTK